MNNISQKLRWRKKIERNEMKSIWFYSLTIDSFISKIWNLCIIRLIFRIYAVITEYLIVVRNLMSSNYWHFAINNLNQSLDSVLFASKWDSIIQMNTAILSSIVFQICQNEFEDEGWKKNITLEFICSKIGGSHSMRDECINILSIS